MYVALSDFLAWVGDDTTDTIAARMKQMEGGNEEKSEKGCKDKNKQNTRGRRSRKNEKRREEERKRSGARKCRRARGDGRGAAAGRGAGRGTCD